MVFGVGVFVLNIGRPPRTTLFPYTTLIRSAEGGGGRRKEEEGGGRRKEEEEEEEEGGRREEEGGRRHEEEGGREGGWKRTGQNYCDTVITHTMIGQI